MIVITGWRSRISEELRRLLPEKEKPVWGKPLEPDFPLSAPRYFFCQGVLYAKRMDELTPAERLESWTVNYTSIRDACDRIVAANNRARICIVGSESGYRGSYDGAYAAAKARLHEYVETKALRTPLQQLVAISPGIIADAGMTTRREDRDNLARRREAHPMKRFLTAWEVAKLAHHLLYEQPYVSGTVIRMNGGDR